MSDNVSKILDEKLRPIIYVAGPYTRPDPVQNTRRAIELGFMLYEKGAVPWVPHCTMLFHLVELHDVDFWYQFDLHALKHCHAVYRFEGESTGSDEECRMAEEFGIPVFYQSEGEWLELLDWIKAWRGA